MNTPVPEQRHRELREQLGAYVLGQLAGDERAEVDRHLDRCPECRAEADDLAPLVLPLSAADPDAVARGSEALGGDAEEGGAPAGTGGFAAIVDRIRAESGGAGPADRAGPDLDPPTVHTRPAPVFHLPADGPGAAAPPAGTPGRSTGNGNGAGPARREPGPRRSGRRPQPATLRLAAAAAVIALAGIGIGTVLAPGSSDGPVESVGVQALRPGIDAEAGVVPHTWGVEVKLTATGFDPGRTYRAAVLDSAGRPVGAGEFVGTGADEMVCNLNSSVLRDRATGFVVTDAAGDPVLVSRFGA